MNAEDEMPTFTNREFVAMVRAELAAAGRPDVTIERSWIDEDEPGYSFILHVPVGAELSVPLRSAEAPRELRYDQERTWLAASFAKALINLKAAEATLIKYQRDVHRAASAVVASARASGLDVLLDRVGFKPTYARSLTDTSWNDAVSYVLASVTIRHTSFYLRPKTSNVWIEEPADVAREMKDILAEQREHQDRMSDLDAHSCDLFVDGITLELLAAHGLDPADILTRAWKKQCLNLKVQHNGEEVALSIITSDGYATASIQMPEAFWNGEHLWFGGEEHDKDHKHLIGKSLGDLVPHPAFTSRPIVDVVHRHADHVVFDLSDKHMFDADNGRIWREERLAA